MSSFSERLKELRGTQNSKEFSRRIGIGAGTLSQYENGKSLPSLRLASQISERLGVPLEWLLHGTKDGKEAVAYTPPFIDAEDSISGLGHLSYQLYEKLVRSLERENALLQDVAALKAENAELKARLSLSRIPRRKGAPQHGVMAGPKFFISAKKNERKNKMRHFLRRNFLPDFLGKH